MNHDDIGALLAHASMTLDAMDDIDDMAPIGAVVDTVVSLREDLTVVCALMAATVPAARVFDMLRQDTSRPWRLQWLTTVAGCDNANAEVLADASTKRISNYVGTDLTVDRVGIEALLVSCVADLRNLIDDAPSVPIPDTVPAAWFQKTRARGSGAQFAAHLSYMTNLNVDVEPVRSLFAVLEASNQ